MVLVDAKPVYTWDELKKLEEKRRRFLVYDENRFYGILLRRFSGTVISYILYDKLFWITILFFTAVRLYDTYAEFEKANVVPDSNTVAVIGGFLSFILTFFVNSAIGDYAASYNVSMKAKGKVTELASVAETVLPHERAQRLVRYVNAAHLVGYTALSDAYNKDNFFTPFNKEIQVLAKHEIVRLQEIDKDLNQPAVCWEIVMWALKEIQDAMEAKLIDSRTAGSLRSIVLDFRGAMSTLFNDADQPSVTFYYYHLISFLCCIYLPLFATYQALEASEITTALTVSDFVQLTVVFVQCCYVIGMRLMATKLMSPYENDTEDLRVITFVKTCWERSNNILNVKYPSHTSAGVMELSAEV